MSNVSPREASSLHDHIPPKVLSERENVSEIMSFDWREMPHLRYALRKEGIHSLAGVEFNADHRAFKKEKFYLPRQWADYPGALTFHSCVLVYIGYESVLPRPLHWLLYRFREPFY